MREKKTLQQIINEFKLIHGNKYNYSNINYVNTQTKVKIICPLHGEFEQQPNNHLMGKGCRKCAGRSIENTYDFIQKAQEVHGNKYDYSKVNYKKTNENIKIIGLIHGEFEQQPCVHIRGNGCKECGKKILSNKLKKTNEDFIKSAIDIHGNKYDYSKVIYNKNNINVIIICKEHGEFEQQPNNHLMGKDVQNVQAILNIQMKNSLKKQKKFMVINMIIQKHYIMVCMTI